MTIFDESQHPRAAAGTFTDKDQSAPELTLALDALMAPVEDIDPDDAAEADAVRAVFVETLSDVEKYQLVGSKDWKVRAAIARSGGDWDDEFLHDEHPEVLIAAGVDPKLAHAAVAAREGDTTTDPDRLDELADVDSDMMHRAVAGNVYVRTSTLVKMSARANSYAHLTVTRRDDCPPELLAELARSGFVVVRKNVAGHANSTPDTLRSLGRDSSQEVLDSLGQNPNTPTFTLNRLFNQSGSIASNAAHAQLKFRASAKATS